LNPEWPEVKLFAKMKEFTLISFRKTLSDQDATRLTKIAAEFLGDLKNLTPHFKIYCKLHHLSHYGDLTRVYGPLYLYSTFRYERKHQWSKGLARVMNCFKSPVSTIHQRHQIMRAVVEKKTDFYEMNFWNNSNPSAHGQIFEDLPSDCIKLKCQEYPFRLRKRIVRRIVQKKENWFLCKEFFREKRSDRIICKGQILKLFKSFQNRRTNSIKHISMFRLSFLHNGKDKFILFDDLDCKNDLIYTDTENLIWLQEWI
jgi:hypothetical protein